MAVSVYDNKYFPVDYFTDRLWPIRYWPVLGIPTPPAPVQREMWTLRLPPSAIFGAVLVQDNVLGAYLAGETWPLFISMLPAEPDDAAAIFDTTPITERRVRSIYFRRQYGLQILLRATDAVQGRLKMGEIVDAMKVMQNRNQMVDGYDYRIKSVAFSTGINHLGHEPGTKRRHLFTLNFLSMILGLEDIV